MTSTVPCLAEPISIDGDEVISAPKNGVHSDHLLSRDDDEARCDENAGPSTDDGGDRIISISSAIAVGNPLPSSPRATDSDVSSDRVSGSGIVAVTPSPRASAKKKKEKKKDALTSQQQMALDQFISAQLDKDLSARRASWEALVRSMHTRRRHKSRGDHASLASSPDSNSKCDSLDSAGDSTGSVTTIANIAGQIAEAATDEQWEVLVRSMRTKRRHRRKSRRHHAPHAQSSGGKENDLDLASDSTGGAATTTTANVAAQTVAAAPNDGTGASDPSYVAFLNVLDKPPAEDGDDDLGGAPHGMPASETTKTEPPNNQREKRQTQYIKDLFERHEEQYPNLARQDYPVLSIILEEPASTAGATAVEKVPVRSLAVESSSHSTKLHETAGADAPTLFAETKTPPSTPTSRKKKLSVRRRQDAIALSNNIIRWHKKLESGASAASTESDVCSLTDSFNSSEYDAGSVDSNDPFLLERNGCSADIPGGRPPLDSSSERDAGSTELEYEIPLSDDLLAPSETPLSDDLQAPPETSLFDDLPPPSGPVERPDKVLCDRSDLTATDERPAAIPDTLPTLCKQQSLRQQSLHCAKRGSAAAEGQNPITVDYIRPLAKFPDGAALGSHLNRWSSPASTCFRVRGPSYLEDKKKVPSENYLLPCRGCDLFLVDDAPTDLGRNRSLLGGKLRDVPTFILSYRLPWGAFLSYHEIPTRFLPFLRRGHGHGDPSSPLPDLDGMSAGERALCRFFLADAAGKNEVLKIVPTVAAGPWVARRIVGGKPALVGQKLPITYTYSPPRVSDGRAEYLEADLDLLDSVTARSILSVVQSHTRSITIDLGFVVQANQAKELPEQMMLGLRLHGMDPSTSELLPEFDNIGAEGA